VLLFLLKLTSRRQFNQEARSPAFLNNLNQLAQTRAETVPYDGTVAYLLEKLPPNELEALPSRMVQRLIRTKALDKFRLFGHFLIAVDGSGMLRFNQRHCPHCLTQRQAGQTRYFHHVLEAKLVTRSGLALSVATEFIENSDPAETKQDCELKAFYRIVKKIKRAFPQMRICLLLDGLYAKAPVFDLCRKNQWRFIVTFKKGSIPDLYGEFVALRQIAKDQREVQCGKGIKKIFAWVSDLPYMNHSLQVFQELEWTAKKKRRFVWITNFKTNPLTVKKLAEEGGRLRWIIENVGFHTQKNGGYNLEHPYSKNHNAAKHFYFLLQIAHMINQLIVHGSLLRQFQAMLGSLRNFSRRMAEHFRNLKLPEELDQRRSPRAFQIRLDSS
jgi:hypothetical protein